MCWSNVTDTKSCVELKSRYRTRPSSVVPQLLPLDCQHVYIRLVTITAKLLPVVDTEEIRIADTTLSQFHSIHWLVLSSAPDLTNQSVLTDMGFVAKLRASAAHILSQWRYRRTAQLYCFLLTTATTQMITSLQTSERRERVS